jgi:hypothetical protein
MLYRWRIPLLKSKSRRDLWAETSQYPQCWRARCQSLPHFSHNRCITMSHNLLWLEIKQLLKVVKQALIIHETALTWKHLDSLAAYSTDQKTISLMG